ncbi:MAG: hypothetical protein FWD05_10895 [Oscillospiraceae bacterium]|nr:hypothetical protein [Oscillospiraceae bacterium]
MSTKVQVTREFLDGVKTLLDELQNHNLEPETRFLCQTLTNELSAKLAAISKRQAYTAYKTTAPGTDNREINRQTYLDQADIHKNWRSSKEFSN